MNVGVIIVTWNSKKFIDGCVGGLIKYESAPIYVVDNGSIDGSADYIAKRYPDVKLLRLPINSGFAGGNNYGTHAALNDGCQAVLLLNVDTIIDEPFMVPCVKILEQNPSIGIVGPTIVEAFTPSVIQFGGGKFNLWGLRFPVIDKGKEYLRSDRIKEVDYVLGAAMLIRRNVIDKTGGLDEEYYPAYVEEADLCYRARLCGFRSVVYQGSRVRHIGLQSSGGFQNAFRRMMANRFLFGLKHLNFIKFMIAAQVLVGRVILNKIGKKYKL
jgi:GT2 family glycosyltransferase